jgi:LysM repeat protein
MSDIIKANNITNPNFIKINQKLVIPQTASASLKNRSQAEESKGGGYLGGTIYEVQKGETRGGLAKKL